MSLIKSGKIGNIQTNREQLLREEIIDKYQHVGAEKNARGEWLEEGQNWLAGLQGHVRDNIALLYENQARYLKESTDTSSVGGFDAVAFPMIRRVFSRLLANDIVSVQAMTQPAGALYFYYPNISERIEETTNGVTTSSHAPSVGGFPACVLEGANCPDVTFSGCRSLYDRFYNDDLYDHSKGSFTIVTATGTPVSLDADGCWVTTNTHKVHSDGTVRYVKFSVSGFRGRTVNSAHSARMNAERGFEVDTDEFLASFTVLNTGAAIRDRYGNVIVESGAQIPYRLPSQAYGRGLVSVSDFCDETGTLYVELDLTHPYNDSGDYDGYVGMLSSTTLSASNVAFAWRRYNSLENETEIGEVTFEFRRETVAVEPRKLRARWTPELAQDVQAYHNIDAEAELTALLSEQVGMEIDRQILRELKKGAAWRSRWNYNGWKNTGSQKYTIKEWNQTLITKINQVSAQIHKSTLRGGANFIVVSTEASAILDDLDVFMPSGHDLEANQYNLGMKQIGTVSGRYKVYVDPYSQPGDVLIGHKGTSLMDTGYIFAPYLPLQLTPTLADPNTFQNVKGIMSRYATKMVNNRYYGVIRIDNIYTFDQFGISELR